MLAGLDTNLTFLDKTSPYFIHTLQQYLNEIIKRPSKVFGQQ